ncbi:MAG: heavy-metal-associated domain-containing protein [Chroococcales cyanobacterium]
MTVVIGEGFMSVQLKVPKLACSACVDTVTEAIKKVDANANVNANPKTKMVNVETNKSESEIKEAIASVGYPAA